MVMDKIRMHFSQPLSSSFMDYHTGSAKPVFCLWLGFQSHTMRVIPAQACVTTDGWMLICILMTSLAEEYMQCSFLFYYFCYFLPSSVTIFSYDVHVNTLVQHSITNSYRTLLYFILWTNWLLWISATTFIFTNYFSITKQTVQTISI